MSLSILPKLKRKEKIKQLLPKLSSKWSLRITILISLKEKTRKDIRKHSATPTYKLNKEWFTQY